MLAKHYHPGSSGSEGPSWLTFIGQAKDSLWSLDLFRCESILLHRHWVLMVMDVFTRRIIGFGVERGHIDGVSVCRMFNHAIAGQLLPRSVSAPTYRLITNSPPTGHIRQTRIALRRCSPTSDIRHSLCSSYRPMLAAAFKLSALLYRYKWCNKYCRAAQPDGRSVSAVAEMRGHSGSRFQHSIFVASFSPANTRQQGRSRNRACLRAARCCLVTHGSQCF